MTVQEAHEYLEDFQRIMTQHREAYSKKLIEANGQAILALEKQIPKKPILDTIFPSGVKWFRCPACNHNGIEKSGCYCHSCGQALDWSDTE